MSKLLTESLRIQYEYNWYRPVAFEDRVPENEGPYLILDSEGEIRKASWTHGSPAYAPNFNGRVKYWLELEY